jgi:hypothetical protein
MISNVDDDEKLNGIIFRAGQYREVLFITEDGLSFTRTRKGCL